MILDGKSLAEQLTGELKARAAGRDIRLAVVLVGNDSASVKYVTAKKKRALEIGVSCDIIELPGDISEDELIKKIELLNNDASVSGVMVQLPLPGHIDQADITHRINPAKDVDGLNPCSGFMPATVRGIEKLMEHYLFGPGFDLDGKIAVVVGRSEIVGKPAAKMLLSHNATVIICHSRTKDLASLTRQADILIAAVGKPGMFTPDYIKDGAVIIDAGTIGDVAKECHAKAAAYTPVPGGVGPMTVISLIENTIKGAL